MRYLVLTASLFIFGCSSGESDADAEKAATTAEPKSASVGEDVADTLNDAQQAARDVEATLKEQKDELDAALDKAEGVDDD